MHPRQFFLDQSNTFQGLDGRIAVDLFSGGEGKGQVVNDEVFRPQIVLCCQLHQPAGDLQFAFGCARHAFFIDRQPQHSRAVLACQGENASGFGVASLKVSRVDQTAPRNSLKSRLDHIGFSRIDHQWHRHFEGKSFHQSAHHLRFVAAFGDGYANIEGMRAKIHLVAGNLEHTVVVLSQQQALEGAGTLRIEALTDNKGRRLLLDCHCLDRRSQGSESFRFDF